MKFRNTHLGVFYLIFLTFRASASVFYVNASNPTPLPPFTTWVTAATNIQDAIDAAGTGDMVLVTNGNYAFGGRVMAGDLSNRVALTNAVTVQSVNGPLFTTIQGGGATNGTAAVRCAWLTNGASLIGFTLFAGATRTTGDMIALESGGGVWCASSNSLVSNCLVVSNNAFKFGGGIYQGTVRNSLISSNATSSSVINGASYQSVLVNCTIVSNATYGVVNPVAMTNCIIYYNNSVNCSFPASMAVSHCCTTVNLNMTGPGNFLSPPLLFADGSHLANNSPCIGAGVYVAAGTDVFGMTWSNPPSVGCAEWHPVPVTTTPQIMLTSDPIGFTIGKVTIGGIPPFTYTWYKDGLPLSDNGHYSSTQTTNLAATSVSFTDAGNYQLEVSNAFGVVTSPPAIFVVHYVNVNGVNPVAPYSSWTTAATNIQNAITAATAGDVVLVTNGIYSTGVKSMDGGINNRVAIDRPILVQSINGAGATIIQGAQDSTSYNGPGAIRCAWVATNGILNGFTLRGGGTSANSSQSQEVNGGGVWGARSNLSFAVSATVANCIITNNTAYTSGGGAYQVALKNCTITANNARGNTFGGSGGSGGGAELSDLKNCIISLNIANEGNGGGVENCTLRNCALTGNSAKVSGGGANGGTLFNCTVAGNNTTGNAAGSGTAVNGSALSNCIVYGNTSFSLPAGPNLGNSTQTFCCTYPPAAGTGNISVDPQLLADNIHLAVTSPCIGMGDSNVVSGVDIDGQPWGSPPSIGCDEWQPVPLITAPLNFQVNMPTHGLTITAIVAGQPPFNFFWSKDGVPVQDDNHFSNSGTASLVVNHLDPTDTGTYQLIVTNATGAATSQVAQVAIHAVNVAATNPVPPYASWATAATNIQDAINAATNGDIVLVTNGIYGTGGKIMPGSPTNRVVLDRAVTVMSMNGYASTVIQGTWDTISTNGPDAVRCVYIGQDGSALIGFMLQNGATLATGDIPAAGGGGVYCNTNKGIVANCVLYNNCAIYGGGSAYGTLEYCLVTLNTAFANGGGAYDSWRTNCTVIYNYVNTRAAVSSFYGAGVYLGQIWNSIVFYNHDNVSFGLVDDNYDSGFSLDFHYSCTSPTISGNGNINAYPQFLDSLHLATTSPCRGTALYTSGTDLDGEPWVNPPSMGCEEVVVSNLVGPLSVSLISNQTNVLVNHYGGFAGFYTGHATSSAWFFGDGQTVTNVGPINHLWTNTGDYTVTYSVYNNDNPVGVSSNTIIHVLPLNVPQLQSAVLLTNGFQFQFTGQASANFTVQ